MWWNKITAHKGKEPPGDGTRFLPNRMEDAAWELKPCTRSTKGRVRWLAQDDMVGQMKFIGKMFGIVP